MSARASKANEYQKECIKRGYEADIPAKTIGIVLGLNPATVRQIWSRMQATINLPPAIVVRKTVINGRLSLAIKKILAQDASVAYRRVPGILREMLPNEPNIPSASAVQRFLADNNIVKRLLSLKAPINERNRLKRLAFVDKWLVNGEDTLGNVIWTDETSVQAVSSHRRQSEWAHESTPKAELPIQERYQQGKFSVMFWGCFSKKGRGPLLAIEGSMNSQRYMEVIEAELLPEIEYAREFYNADFKLMQDNAPCHKARIVTDFLAEKGIEFIDWPPYSPDMNPIENLWHWMKDQFYKKFPPPTSRDQLIDNFTELWLTVTPEMCEAYCSNYEKRLKALRKAKGMHTKY